MEFVQHYYEEGRPLAAPKLVAKDKKSEISAVHVDERHEDKTIIMAPHTSSSIGGVFMRGQMQIQQRQESSKKHTQLDFYRALTTNLPGFVCAYGGHTSPVHQWGVRQLHKEQCRGESFPAPPAWWRYTRTGNLRSAYYNTKLCYWRQVKQLSNSPVPNQSVRSSRVSSNMPWCINFK